jgi:hypothetical protein
MIAFVLDEHNDESHDDKEEDDDAGQRHFVKSKTIISGFSEIYEFFLTH